jgi:hypothetical protein
MDPFKNIIPTALLAVASCFFSHSGMAQGAWSLRYLPIDSVNESFVRKEVRIDFKGRREKFTWTGNVRAALSKHDTIHLKVQGKSMRFFEDWNVYVDHGVLSEQTLRRVTKDSTEALTVKEVFIHAVEKATITVELYLYRPGAVTKSGTQLITLKRSLVNGVVFGKAL